MCWTVAHVKCCSAQIDKELATGEFFLRESEKRRKKMSELRYGGGLLWVFMSCRDWWERVHNGLCFISGAEDETGWSFIQETRAAAERFHSSEREGSCEEEQTRYSKHHTQISVMYLIQYTSRNMRQASIYIYIYVWRALFQNAINAKFNCILLCTEPIHAPSMFHAKSLYFLV